MFAQKVYLLFSYFVAVTAPRRPRAETAASGFVVREEVEHRREKY